MSTQPPSDGAEEPVATDPAPGVAHGAPMFQVTTIPSVSNAKIA